MLKMILKDLRLSPLRSILTSISMLVGIIAMIASVLVGTLGKEYLISVNAQVYGWTPTYAFVITEASPWPAPCRGGNPSICCGPRSSSRARP